MHCKRLLHILLLLLQKSWKHVFFVRETRWITYCSCGTMLAILHFYNCTFDRGFKRFDGLFCYFSRKHWNGEHFYMQELHIYVRIVLSLLIWYVCRYGTYCFDYPIFSFWITAFVDCVLLPSNDWDYLDVSFFCELSRSRTARKGYWRRSWKWWVVLEWTGWKFSATRSVVLQRMQSEYITFIRTTEMHG